MSTAAGYPPPAWNATDRPFRSDAVVTQLVVEAARRAPGAPAVVAGDGTVYTYAELLAEANRLGRLLHDLGLGPGDHVGVVGRHRPETVVALVGVALSGATFVPVSPDWPVSRIGYVLASTGARCLVGGADDVARVDGLPPAAPGLTDLVALDVDTERPEPTSRERTAAVDDAHADRVGRLVLAERPSSVLEVGFGSCAVLRQVAPHVDLYSGTDPEEHAVRAGTAWADAQDVLVDLVQGYADQVRELLPGTVDVAVVAGVAERFPDARYLRTVLDELAEVVRPGGAVVLGDAPVDVPPLCGGAWSAEGSAEQDVVLRRAAGTAPAAPEPGCLPRLWTRWHVARQQATDLPVRARPEQVAYVIFTSGSTGQPKGVAVAHDALVNLVQWVNERFSVGPGDRLLQVTSFCFDLSVYDVFGILSAGASIRMVADEDLAEPARVARILESEPITFWNSAPAAFAWVLPFLSGGGRQALRLVFLAGDWIPLSMPGEIAASFPRAELVNLGGATETTIWSTYYVVGDVDPSWQSIPYGRPIQNARYYILDERGEPTPIDVAGDLYTAGPCLALGYHGDPAQTAARFLPDPLVPGARMYATGDRGRWRSDGEIQFLGRLDHQVKVRGFRVELGEIEAVLAALDGVRAAVVVAVDSAGSRSLAGFYTCRGQGPGVETARAALAGRLPEYMVPSRLSRLGELPLTANGKVDRAALTELAQAGQERVEPDAVPVGAKGGGA